MRPELPYLGAGALAVAGGAIREKRWPREGTTALIGTTVLVLAASATAESRVAPLVHAIGMLFLLAAVMATVRSVQDARKKK